MTKKQERFCAEYLVDCNATQAAIRAGYSEKTAYSIGVENLKKPEIRKYIDEQLEAMQDATVASAQEVIQYLSSVMRGGAGWSPTHDGLPPPAHGPRGVLYQRMRTSG